MKRNPLVQSFIDKSTKLTKTFPFQDVELSKAGETRDMPVRCGQRRGQLAPSLPPSPICRVSLFRTDGPPATLYDQKFIMLFCPSSLFSLYCVFFTPFFCRAFMVPLLFRPSLRKRTRLGISFLMAPCLCFAWSGSVLLTS